MIFFLSLTLSVLLPEITPPYTASNSLNININGAENKENSKLFIAIYRPSDPFPEFGKGWKNEIHQVKGSSQVISLDLPNGMYALAVFQDINNNNKLDKNVFGYPTEPFGFSRNFRPILGKPDFNDCSFTYSGDKTTMTIRLIR